MAFDITKLNQSSFRGIPFYTDDEDFSGGQRLTDHKFINGGTETESNGVNNNIFKIKAYIGGDNYLDQKEALRLAFEDITSGTLIDKFNGTHEVYVEKWSIKESRRRFGRADIDVTFKKAENQVIEDIDIVFSADAREQIEINFLEDFDNTSGDDIRDSIIKDIIDFWNGILDIIKFIEDAKGELEALKALIGKIISSIKTAILSVETLMEDILNIFLTFDEVLNTELFGVEEQKSFTNTMRGIIVESSDKTSQNEAEATAIRQSQTYTNTVIAGLTQTAISNLENVNFNVGDDFGSVKDDVLTIYEILQKDIIIDSDSPIDDIINKQNLLDKYHEIEKEFIQFYTQKYSGLQELKDNSIVATTDILNLTMEKYNDISRVSEVLINNDIVDPLFINGNIELLDR